MPAVALAKAGEKVVDWFILRVVEGCIVGGSWVSYFWLVTNLPGWLVSIVAVPTKSI